MRPGQACVPHDSGQGAMNMSQGRTWISGGLAAVLAAAVLTLFGCWSRPVQVMVPAGQPHARLPGEAADYIGGDSCQECHAEQSESFSLTSHANTVQEATVERHGDMFRKEATLLNPGTQSSHSPAVVGGRVGFKVATPEGERFYPAVWALGASNHGTTFLCEDPEGFLTEGQLTYYPAERGWNYTPGQPNPAPVPFAIGRREVEEKCLPCHSSSVVWRNKRLDLGASRLGIGCESCHGPARAHVESMRRDMAGPLRIARLGEVSQLKQVGVCGQCHRPPGPGPDSEEAEGVSLPRLQGEALGMSLCFQNSEGRLTCGTCHDPHADAVRGLRNYDAKCRDCHGGNDGASARWVACSIGRTKDCVSCHMPLHDVGLPSKLLFRLHWIQRPGTMTGP